MTHRRPSDGPRMYGRLVLTLGVAVMLVVGSACGDDDAEPQLGAAAERGRQLSRDNGCSGCHSASGAESTGPTWKGLWGTTVELEDGRSVTVDRDYVARSVREPSADVVAGYSDLMPTFDLDDDEVDDLVAYLEALAPTADEGDPLSP